LFEGLHFFHLTVVFSTFRHYLTLPASFHKIAAHLQGRLHQIWSLTNNFQIFSKTLYAGLKLKLVQYWKVQITHNKERHYVEGKPAISEAIRSVANFRWFGPDFRIVILTTPERSTVSARRWGTRVSAGSTKECPPIWFMLFRTFASFLLFTRSWPMDN